AARSPLSERVQGVLVEGNLLTEGGIADAEEGSEARGQQGLVGKLGGNVHRGGGGLRWRLQGAEQERRRGQLRRVDQGPLAQDIHQDEIHEELLARRQPRGGVARARRGWRRGRRRRRARVRGRGHRDASLGGDGGTADVANGDRGGEGPRLGVGVVGQD